MTAEPDPRTAADDDEDATNRGESAQAPAEGSNAANPPADGSPHGAELGAGTTGG